MNRGEQKQQTRRKLIDIAFELSAHRGFSALSLREIAKAAGITPAAFYRHFRDVDELGLVLVDEAGLALRRLVREARRRYSQGSRTRASVEAFIDYVNANPHLFRLLLGERLGGSPAFRRALRTEIDRFVAELCDDLESNGSFPDAALAAEAMVAVVFTVGAEALDLPKHKQAPLSERIIAELDLIIRGAESTAPPSRRRARKPRR